MDKECDCLMVQNCSNFSIYFISFFLILTFKALKKAFMKNKCIKKTISARISEKNDIAVATPNLTRFFQKKNYTQWIKLCKINFVFWNFIEILSFKPSKNQFLNGFCFKSSILDIPGFLLKILPWAPNGTWSL